MTMTRQTPTVHDDVLVAESGDKSSSDDAGPLKVGSSEWFAWLEASDIFLYDDPTGQFTARKKSDTAGSHWYASSLQDGESHLVFLGASAALTPQHLRNVAQTFSHQGGVSSEETSTVAQEPHMQKSEEQRASLIVQPRLLTTKLSAPQARSSRLVRTHIVDRLGMVTERPLSLISAPAGFGKTSLLTQWAAESHAPFAWLSLDVGDNDPVRFWTYVAAALDTVAPGLLEMLLSLVNVPQPHSLEPALTALINALAQAPNPTILALDDYHFLHEDNAALHESVTFLLEHLPPHVHLVIASRSDPPLPLPRLRVHSQIHEIRAQDLRLTSEETATFLNDCMGLCLSPAEIGALEARTEGWIAALQLAALSLQDHTDIPQAIATFSGSNRYIFDFLIDEVLTRLPADMQAFMLETAVLDRLCASLCDAVTGARQGQDVLEALEHANLFLTPMDDQRTWYRYHALFVDVLRLRLGQIQPERLPDLYRRASEWCETRGYIAESIDYALRGGDPDRAAQLTEADADDCLMTGRVATLRQRLEGLPDGAISARPHLSVVHAYSLLLNSQFDLFMRRLHDAAAYCETAFDDTLSEPPQSDDQRMLWGEIRALRATVAFLQGDFQLCQRLCQQALIVLPEQHTFRAHVLMSLGTTQWLTGDTLAASQSFTDVRSMSEAQGNAYYFYSGLTSLAQVRLVQGRLDEAIALCLQALQQLTIRGAVSETSGLHQVIGTALYERNELEDAAKHLERCIELSRGAPKTPALLCCLLALAYVRLAQNDTIGSLQLMDQLRNESHSTWPWYTDYMGAQLARLWLLHANTDAASAWARAYEERQGRDEGETAAPLLMREWERIVLARVYLAEDRLADAAHILTELLPVVEAEGHVIYMLEILTLLAVVYERQGDLDVALDTVKRVVAVAQSHNLMRTIVDGGGLPMQRLATRLQAAWAQYPEITQDATGAMLTAYLAKVLAAFGESGGPMMFMHAVADHRSADQTEMADLISPSQRLIEPLSEREREVMDLLASGASNQDIAHELVIAMGTVKRHVSNIFMKLGSQSRTQAVARAHELRLIDPQHSAPLWKPRSRIARTDQATHSRSPHPPRS